MKARQLVRQFLGKRKARRSPGATTRRRHMIGEALENRMLLAGDVVLDGQLKVRFEYVERDTGAQVDTLRVGQEYTLNTYVEDQRGAVASGVRHAFFDIVYNQIITVDGDAESTAEYNDFGDPGDGTTTPGRIVRAGGTDADLSPSLGELLLFTIPITADSVGTLDLDIQPVPSPADQPAFWSPGTPIPLVLTDIVCDTIEIVAAGFDITPTSGLVTAEAGDADTFDVSLSEAPSSDVTLQISSNNPDEGIITSATTLTFTPANWDDSQTITVEGVDDDVDDGPVAYAIQFTSSSSDSDFNNISIPSVSVTNSDDDTAGITVTGASGLITTEDLGGASFEVVLDSEPTGTVTIPLSVSNSNEGSVSPAQLVFTAENWDTAQQVNIQGVDDDAVDGPQTYTVLLGQATSSDPLYAAIDPGDVSVTNEDNDAAGLTFANTAGLSTVEGGQSDMFTVVLNSRPESNVTVRFSSSDTTEGTVAPGVMQFTPTNWFSPRTVNINSVDDDIVDGDIGYSISTQVTSSDADYNDLTIDPIAVTNLDSGTEQVGINVSPASNLITTEAGADSTFEVVLTSEPIADVVVGLTSSDIGEVALAQSQLTFTSLNWNAPQTVTVEGVDDQVVDGGINVTIQTTASSSDPAYNGLQVADVTVTNEDNDTAGVLVDRTSGLTTSESGGADNFGIRLNSEPVQPVTISFTSSNPTEGTVSPQSITFDASNWDSSQTVTITGVDDTTNDGDVPYSINATASSSDTAYNGISIDSVSATNLDDDVTVTISPVSGLTTSEAGETAMFTAVLDQQPTADVTIGLTSDNTDEGTISATSLIFTNQNWNIAQTITITGVNDNVDDGDVSYQIITAPIVSADANFNGFDPADISVTNQDDQDTAGVTIDAAANLEIAESGSSTSFTVVLDSEPVADVTISATASETTEGTLSAQPLTFTSTNWNVPQTITITGVDDAVDDDDVSFDISFSVASTDANYAAVSLTDLQVTNIDDDTAGITIDPPGGLTTGEDGTADNFSVVLNSQPTGNVTVTVTSSDSTEGSLGTTSLTFTDGNWNQPQQVIVTGVDDSEDDRDVDYNISVSVASNDSNYDALQVPSISATNVDDDVNVTISPVSGLITDETGRTATFTIVLDQEPTADVVIGLTSSDSNEGTISANSVTFTDQNWDTAQTITVTGVNDDIDDGDVPYQIITAPIVSADANFGGFDPSNISVTNEDDLDAAGITIAADANLQTTEAGGSTSFTVVLDSEPAADVVVDAASSDTSEGTVSPQLLTFDSGNWNVPQTITITGVNDAVDDDDVSFDIDFSVTSTDGNYATLTPASLPVLNADDDNAGVTVAPSENLTTGEDGTNDNFTVVLDSQPTADVTITIASSDTTEGTVTPTTLTFTETDWNQPQQVTVFGVDDQDEDRNVDYDVTVTVASADAKYNAFAVPSLTVTNVDDEVGVRITPSPAGLTTNETGTTTFFDAVLSQQPTGNVTFDIASNLTSEATISDSTLTFTSANWDQPQRVTITGEDDSIVDGDKSVTIVTSAVVSSDPLFDGFDPIDLTVTNEDDDTAVLRVTAATVSQAEGTGVATTEYSVSVELTSAVENGLSINYQTIDGTAVAASGDFQTLDDSLTFAGAAETQTLTIVVNQDSIVEEDETLRLVFDMLMASNPSVASQITLEGSDLSFTIQNDDTTTLTLTGTESISEGNADSTIDYTVTLSNPVQGGLSLAYATADDNAVSADADFTASTGSFDFQGNASEALSATVTVRGDNMVETDEAFRFELGQISGVSAAVLEDISIVTNSITTTLTNDDSATITLVGPAITEEGTGTGVTGVVFELQLSAPVQGSLTVPFTTDDGTATIADADYVDNDGNVLFASGDNATKMLTVSVNQDDRVEIDETFSVTIGNPTGVDQAILSNLTIGNATATATIDNDDFPRLILSPLSPMQTEGTGGDTVSQTFMVTLSDAVNDPDGFQVAFTTDDVSAIAGADYVDNDGTLSFDGTAGEMKTITVLISADSIVEGEESFELNLGEITGLAAGERILIPNRQSVITIFDDDQTTLSLSDTVVTQVEGTGNAQTEVAVTVTLSNATDRPFTIPLSTVDGSATAASGDFNAVDSQLSFTGTAGETQTVRVLVNQDNIVEPDESFQISFGNITAFDAETLGRISADLSTVTANITDDDSATVTIENASQVEGPAGANQTLDFTVTLSAPIQGGLSVPYSTVDGTATTVDSDYQSTTGSLQFDDAGATTVPVTLLGDSKVERDETFQISLGTIAGLPASIADRVSVTAQSATGTISNDDLATISFVEGTSSVDEQQGTHQFGVRLDAGPAGTIDSAVTVLINVVDSGTTASSDFTQTTTSITFPAGSRTGDTQQVVLQLTDDGEQETNETVTFGLSIDGNDIGGAVAIGSTGQHTVEITDDPRDASISGSVWVNNDNNSTADSGEKMIAGVTVRLSGIGRSGESIGAVAVTDSGGNYRFDNLPGGTYSVTQVQPERYLDGGPNVVSGIALSPSESNSAVGFNELGLRASAVVSTRMLARPIERGQASMTLDTGGIVERSGSQVTIIGTSDRDIIKVTPAQNAAGQHLVEINGETQSFGASEVSVIRVDGGAGDDDITLSDTPGDDRLNASVDQAILETANLRVEAIAFEFIEAISSSGGSDRVSEDSTDALLRLRGPWN